MTCGIVLASKSQIRSLLLEKAGIQFSTVDPAIDEKEVKLSYISNNYPTRDIADVLADMKARKISNRFPDSIVIGCYQILDFNSKILSKAKDQDELIHQLKQLQGNKHKLHSACVVYNAQKPEWRFIGSVSMTMRNLSDRYISKYVQDNWDDIKHSVGGYQLESSGISLFSKIDGDYFSVLGLPIIQLIDHLLNRGVIEQ
jgi:septum formation protein